MQTTARTARRNTTKARIQDVALELFLEHGYQGASLEAIVAKAGGSRRNIYELFGNKEGLFVACIEGLSQDLLGKLNGIELRQEVPQAVLTQIGTVFLQAMTSAKMLSAFRLAIGTVGTVAGIGEHLYRAGPAVAYQVVASYLQTQNSSARRDSGEIARDAVHFVEMVKGDIFLHALLCPEFTPSERQIASHVQQTVQDFLRMQQV